MDELSVSWEGLAEEVLGQPGRLDSAAALQCGGGGGGCFRLINCGSERGL